MPSGGSTYPEGTPGVGLAIAPDDPLSLLVAVARGNGEFVILFEQDSSIR